MFERYKELLLFMFGYWALCVMTLLLTNKLIYIGLAWNLFLAFLPLFFIEKAISASRQEWARIWGILWFIFFPNALYPISSFIHLSIETFYWVEGNYPTEDVVYGDDIFIWLKLFMIGIGFFASIIVGLYSLYIFEWMIRMDYSKRKGQKVVLLVTFLTGIAVYWGRFLRLNSWDIILRPWLLLKEIFSAINFFMLEFVFAFTIYAVVSYGIFKLFRKMMIHQQNRFEN
ncbi:DUF1361 domain-containing protein [Jeotgalibaca sp. MA1X17-3]|uniref:DUF1361 domain-containing protein n=1 Tax=Jeotgalibaca sp. MA1X17-3 TaxID=2908211 RepID=UPI001F45A97D|nr:DUF1361 domain-containing protein [Jeotgalibaca sp. MA1X17-3]UJF15405.1 DUF1361 domain-containing protein [Jeotgalibaca sp. MA1X17-3]